LGYYIRVLGKTLTSISLEELQKAAHPAVLDLSEGGSDDWQELILKHRSGTEIAIIEKNPVVEGALGVDELQEFLDEVPHYKPDSAAAWLRQYLPAVKCIYAFQLLSGTDVDDGWTRLHGAYNTVWNHAGGILQADGEGFSNEDGYTILWQFGETVSGMWNVGILSADGDFVHFQMDLGNQSIGRRSGRVSFRMEQSFFDSYS
jgi:hypothetical protein